MKRMPDYGLEPGSRSARNGPTQYVARRTVQSFRPKEVERKEIKHFYLFSVIKMLSCVWTGFFAIISTAHRKLFFFFISYSSAISQYGSHSE